MNEDWSVHISNRRNRYDRSYKDRFSLDLGSDPKRCGAVSRAPLVHRCRWVERDSNIRRYRRSVPYLEHSWQMSYSSVNGSILFLPLPHSFAGWDLYTVDSLTWREENVMTHERSEFYHMLNWSMENCFFPLPAISLTSLNECHIRSWRCICMCSLQWIITSVENNINTAAGGCIHPKVIRFEKRMRRAIKEKLSGILDDPRPPSNTRQSISEDQQRRPMTDRMVGFVRDRSTALASTVQEHVTSMTDMTGTLAKQKLLQTLFSSGMVQGEHVRRGLQLGKSMLSKIECHDGSLLAIRDWLLSRSTIIGLWLLNALHSTSEIPSSGWNYPTTFSTWFRHRSAWAGRLHCSDAHLRH